jgi:hypothetical protein
LASLRSVFHLALAFGEFRRGRASGPARTSMPSFGHDMAFLPAGNEPSAAAMRDQEFALSARLLGISECLWAGLWLVWWAWRSPPWS